MRKLWSILLLGALSMLFAEIFSGASKLWFVDPWGAPPHIPLVSRTCGILAECSVSVEKDIASSAVLLRDAVRTL